MSEADALARTAAQEGRYLRLSKQLKRAHDAADASRRRIEEDFVIRMLIQFPATVASLPEPELAADPQFLRRLFYAKRMSEPTQARRLWTAELIEWMLADWMLEDDNHHVDRPRARVLAVVHSAATLVPVEQRLDALGVAPATLFPAQPRAGDESARPRAPMPSPPTRARALAAEAAAGCGGRVRVRRCLSSRLQHAALGAATLLPTGRGLPRSRRLCQPDGIGEARLHLAARRRARLSRRTGHRRRGGKLAGLRI